MSDMYQIGVDESGRGPMLGPLVVVAVAIPSEDLKILKDFQINDSKKLSSKKRKIAYENLEKMRIERNWKIEIIVCEPIEIDFAMETTNLNTLETELFAKSINKLNINKLGGGKIILDACDVNEERFGNRVTKLIENWNPYEWNIISKHSADELFKVVGAASIIAKVTRDKLIENLESQLGFEIGSGYPSDDKSKSALSKLCEGDFPNEHLRWEWSSIQKYWNKVKGRNPPKRKYKKIKKINSRQSSLDDY